MPRCSARQSAKCSRYRNKTVSRHNLPRANRCLTSRQRQWQYQIRFLISQLKKRQMNF